MTELDLSNATWYDISIMPTKDNKRVLILLCRDADRAKRLKGIIDNNLFALYLNKAPNKEFELILSFPKEDMHIKFPTKQTEISYPPLLYLAKSEIPYITTGIKDGSGMMRWDDNYHLLEPVNLN